MSLQLSPRSQRLRSRKAEFTHQIIVFRLRQEWFALPIQAAQKVIPLGKVYGAGAGSAIGLTLYQDREIPLLDIQQRIFGTATQALLTGNPSPPKQNASHVDPFSLGRFLLLVQTITGATIGFPLDAQPMLRRVPESAFTPLSATYLAEGQLRCIKCLIIPAPEQPPIFLLNLDQLLQAQSALPHAAGD
ncbi:MAG: chemotaxis protein CheW [Verrucomicrobia bacterium]|nr:chemotaxis protein CheW [Leptolyngbya sp. ES-bin-22]